MNSRYKASNNIRLLIMDVDGTLVGADRNISAPVREALLEARRYGIRIAVGTGRPGFSTKRYIEELDIEGVHIFDSGASVIDTVTANLVYHHGISKVTALAFLKEARQANLHVELYADEQYFIEAERPHSRIHAEILRQPPVIANLVDVIETRPVTKLEIVVLDEVERTQALAVSARFTDQLDTGSAGAPGTSADFINVLAKGVSKGTGAAQVAAYYGLEAAQVIAIGDGQNDEPLLRFAGIGVAMGNAPEALKLLADWVVPSIEEDGLAYAIKRYILGMDILDS